MRIRDEDCDIERLTVADFDEGNACSCPDYFGKQEPEHATYFLQMVKLVKLRESMPALFTMFLLTRIPSWQNRSRGILS
jgi:hypothetical protein